MKETENVEALMDKIRTAMTAANYSCLSVLGQQLETALAALPASSDRIRSDRAGLERLRLKAERNAACALAAGRGVRAALHRLKEIRQATGGLVTYDQNGKRSDQGGSGRLSQRF